MNQNRKSKLVGILTALSLVIAMEGHSQEKWQHILIETDEYRFVPKRIVIKEGRPVKIEIKNIGNEDHEFRSRFFKGPLIEIAGGGIQVQGTDFLSLIILSGASASIKWLNPKEGEYLFECRIPSHHGMDGIILVEANE